MNALPGPRSRNKISRQKLGHLSSSRTFITMGKIYQVIVIGFRGEKMVIDVSNTEEQMNSMTVLQLKNKISERLPGNSGDNLETLRLIFTNKQLEDSSVLSSYGIQNQSVIQLVMRVPGGWTH
uniref:Ubiquitin-like domain-containing protein n=2 Tax=Oncorhynchus tshawytscha TaxID=74940 RepID=A0AAZ3R8J2_ONCTS